MRAAASAGPRPAGVSMGCHAAGSNHAQELGFSTITLLTDHFQLNPGFLLTSGPCAKDPFSVKPNEERQGLVNVRSRHRGQTINAFTSGKTEARGGEPTGSVCRGRSCRGATRFPSAGPKFGAGRLQADRAARLAVRGHKRAALPATSNVSVAAGLLAYHGKVALGKYAMYF